MAGIRTGFQPLARGGMALALFAECENRPNRYFMAVHLEGQAA